MTRENFDDRLTKILRGLRVSDKELVNAACTAVNFDQASFRNKKSLRVSSEDKNEPTPTTFRYICIWLITQKERTRQGKLNRVKEMFDFTDQTITTAISSVVQRLEFHQDKKYLRALEIILEKL